MKSLKLNKKNAARPISPTPRAEQKSNFSALINLFTEPMDEPLFWISMRNVCRTKNYKGIGISFRNLFEQERTEPSCKIIEFELKAVWFRQYTRLNDNTISISFHSLTRHVVICSCMDIWCFSKAFVQMNADFVWSTRRIKIRRWVKIDIIV